MASKNTIPDWLLKARNKWQFNGKERPSFAQDPKKGQVSVWDFPRPPALVKVQQQISVYSGEICLAKTNQAYAVMETAHPPSLYVSGKAPQPTGHLNLHHYNLLLGAMQIRLQSLKP